mgnify:CR=1 FL=1
MDKLVVISLKMPQSLLEKVDTMAYRMKMRRSELIRSVLEEWISKNYKVESFKVKYIKVK